MLSNRDSFEHPCSGAAVLLWLWDRGAGAQGVTVRARPRRLRLQRVARGRWGPATPGPSPSPAAPGKPGRAKPGLPTEIITVLHQFVLRRKLLSESNGA